MTPEVSETCAAAEATQDSAFLEEVRNWELQPLFMGGWRLHYLGPVRPGLARSY